MPIAIENNREQFQYQIFKAGELAGFVQYSMDGADMWVLHTSMKRQFKSALLIDMLIHHVLTDAHTSRLALLPFCPAVRAFIAEHREYAFLVTAEWQERIPSPAHHKADADANIPLDFVRLTGSRRAQHLDTTLGSPDVDQYINGNTGPLSLTHLQDPAALAQLQDPEQQSVDS
ncbi:N-acetyltransferase [Micrococcaceae bacterium RIT802]|nr:N-acetyltransferase [Micrococcaceae bacterium RIT 802]